MDVNKIKVWLIKHRIAIVVGIVALISIALFITLFSVWRKDDIQSNYEENKKLMESERKAMQSERNAWQLYRQESQERIKLIEQRDSLRTIALQKNQVKYVQLENKKNETHTRIDRYTNAELARAYADFQP